MRIASFTDLDGGQEVLVAGRANSGDGVPSGSGVEASESAVGAAVREDVVTLGHIVESGRVGLGGLVDPWVKETKGGFSGVEALLVQERNDGSEGGGRGGGSTNGLDASLLDDLEVNVTQSSDVRSSSVGGIVSASRRELDARIEVGIDLSLLFGGGREVVREASTRLEADGGLHDGLLGSGVASDEGGGADGGNVGAGGRERRIESAFAASTDGRASSARVTTGKDDANTTDAGFLEFGVESIAIVIGGIVALRAVADRVDPWGAGLVGDFGGPDEEIVPEVVALEGVEPGGDVGDNTHDVLDVKTGFISRVLGNVGSNDDGNVLEGSVGDEV